MRKHQNRHWEFKPFICGRCEMTGFSKNEVNSHSKRVHKSMDPVVIEMPRPSTTEFRQIRPKNTKDEQVKILVMLKSETLSSRKMSRKGLASKSMLKCYHCDIYGSLNLQKLHHDLSHANLPFRAYRYTCSECLDIFTKVLHVKKHISEHHSDLPVKFSSIYDLYKCSLCDFTNYNQAAVKDHIGEHMAIYECCDCSKSFSNISKMQSHLSSEHNGGGSFRNILDSSEHGLILQSIDSDPFVPFSSQIIKQGLCLTRKVTARKSTAKPNAPVPKQTARKSTSALNLPEGFSYYGCSPEETDYKTITTTVEVMGKYMTLSVKQLSDIIDIFPTVQVQDCRNKQL